jgi:Arc/MetJ family transcription regulator
MRLGTTVLPVARYVASSDARIHAAREDDGVRTTIALDDDLLAEAQRLTGTTEKTALVRQALTALIERESARRLARLGGSEPALDDIPRRRSAAS